MVWKSKKRTSERKWQKRAHAGYTEYRYGVAKKPTLPQVFKGADRTSAINQIMDVLHDWRDSPFENEGEARHSVRSGLCLKGSPWGAADHEAAGLLSEAFGRMGITRPTWEEAQRWYTEPQENCRGCGRTLMGEVKNGIRIMFCSTECANLAWKNIEVRRSADKTYSAIYRAALRFRFNPVPCKECSREFRPRSEGQQFCSQECVQASLRTLGEISCRHCSSFFQPKTSQTKFCSQQCYFDHSRAQEVALKCDLCGIDFTGAPRKKAGVFCCNKHAVAAAQIKKKSRIAFDAGRVYKPVGPHREYALRLIEEYKRRDNVIYLTAEIFDTWFKRAA
ncbi:hypothetical protein CFBP6625_01030 [Agrobacterium tumefaciens]|nr:hypothetical protein CFBP6625_01030 [Agrobacterium tumefaciens]